jgi:hypothetical protein
MHPATPEPTVALRRENWLKAHEEAGRTTSEARANYIGVSRAQVSRIENLLLFPGNRFVASTIMAFQHKFKGDQGRTFKFFFEATTDLDEFYDREEGAA